MEKDEEETNTMARKEQTAGNSENQKEN